MGGIGEVGFRQIRMMEAAVGEIGAGAVGLRQIGFGKIHIFRQTLGELHLFEG